LLYLPVQIQTSTNTNASKEAGFSHEMVKMSHGSVPQHVLSLDIGLSINLKSTA